MIFRMKKDKRPPYGKDHCCKLLNEALRDLLSMRVRSNNKDKAIESIYLAIMEADGFIYEDVANMLSGRGLPLMPERIVKVDEDVKL